MLVDINMSLIMIRNIPSVIWCPISFYSKVHKLIGYNMPGININQDTEACKDHPIY